MQNLVNRNLILFPRPDLSKYLVPIIFAQFIHKKKMANNCDILLLYYAGNNTSHKAASRVSTHI